MKRQKIYESTDAIKDLPLSEIERRKAICDSCPFNSKNAKDLTVIQKIQHQNGNFCTKCSCYIENKVQRSNESCGLVEVGETPLWTKVILKTENEAHLDVKNRSFQKSDIRLSENRESVLIELFDTSNRMLPFSLVVENANVKLVAVEPYCDCLKVQMDGLQIAGELDTEKFSKGKFQKSFEVFYVAEGVEGELSTVFTLVGEKV